MSSDDGDHGDNDDRGWLDEWQEDHGDERYDYTNPRYEELGADEWPHRDPDRIYGGVAWGDSESFSSYEQAMERYNELIEFQNDLTGSGYRELGDIHMYLNDNYDWEIDYHVFIEGATGDS